MRRSGVVKFGYFLGLISVMTWITNNVAGGVLYQRAEGIVVGDPGTISPEYTVTVLELLVRNGDLVKKGDVVARVSSSRVAEITATLSAQSSTLIARMAEINAKASMMDQLIASAEARDRTVETNGQQLEQIRN